MKRNVQLLFLAILLVLPSIGNSQQLAFPTAEGFGRFASGGRGGEVYHVTNLNDAGPGSFRDAVSQSNRIVVFDVGGVIHLNSLIVVQKNITIAGQTAPGEGITIYGKRLAFNGNSGNNIIRYLRVRLGADGNGKSDDAVSISDNKDNYIFDHVSVSWGRDGTFDINSPGSDNITIQDCIIGQGLDANGHSTGGLIQCGPISYIRTLWIDNETRNPKIRFTHEIINNVIYNWGSAGLIMGDTDNADSPANLIGSYFIAGPSSDGNSFATSGTDRYLLYQEDNWLDNDKNGILGGRLLTNSDFENKGSSTVETKYDYPGVNNVLSASDALNYVINNAGASKVRDEVDELLISQLQSYGTEGAIINREVDNGIPNNVGTVASGYCPIDTDQDGMPNYYEELMGYNKYIQNHNEDADNDGYTDIEEYFEWLLSSDYVAPDENEVNPLLVPSSMIQERALGFCKVDGAIENGNAGFTGTGYANTDNATGKGVTYTVDLSKTDNYAITFRYASPSSRPAKLIVNDATVISSINFPTSGGWASWSTVTVELNLPEGINTVRLEATTNVGLANIDYIDFGSTNALSTNCVEGSNTEVVVPSNTIQENSLGFCGLDGSINNNNAGFTGTGFANTDNAKGKGVNYKVSIPADGSYNITFRYAGTSSRPGKLMVNGVTAVPSINFPSTGAWTTWKTVSTDVTLTKGISTIRLEATGSSGLGNIDYMEFSNVDAVGADCNAIQYGVRIEAESFIRGESNVRAQTNASLSGGGNVGYIKNGGWIKFSGINFTGNENKVDLSAKMYDGGNIEFRLGSTSGTLIGTATISSGSGYQMYSAAIAPPAGEADLYLVFKGTSTDYLFNLDYFMFDGIIPEFNLSSAVNLPSAGSSSIAPVKSTYELGTIVTFSAAANSGYEFSHWKDASGLNISGQNPYTFDVAKDLTLTAIFKDITPPVLVEVQGGLESSLYPVDGVITLVFDKEVRLKPGATANMGLREELIPTASGNTVSVPYSGLDYDTKYGLSMLANTVSNVYGYYYASPISFNFVTVPEPAPVPLSNFALIFSLLAMVVIAAISFRKFM